MKTCYVLPLLPLLLLSLSLCEGERERERDSERERERESKSIVACNDESTARDEECVDREGSKQG